MSRKYELQAARIEAVLSAHKVPARVWQATVTPRFVRFDVTTALGTRINKVSSLAEELAFSLGAQAARSIAKGSVACGGAARHAAYGHPHEPVRQAEQRAAQLRGARRG